MLPKSLKKTQSGAGGSNPMPKPKTFIIFGDDFPPNPLGEIGINPTTEERAAHDASETVNRRAFDDIEKQKHTVALAGHDTSFNKFDNDQA